MDNLIRVITAGRIELSRLPTTIHADAGQRGYAPFIYWSHFSTEGLKNIIAPDLAQPGRLSLDLSYSVDEPELAGFNVIENL